MVRIPRECERALLYVCVYANVCVCVRSEVIMKMLKVLKSAGWGTLNKIKCVGE